MNPVLQQIHSHRSVRKFRNDPVPPAVLERTLEAGLRASSSGNMQSYSVIVTSDPAIRQELFTPHFEQSMVLEAPLFLTFCADFHRMRLWLSQNEAPLNFDNFMSFMIATIDATLASQNVALAAESEGLGLCYMGTTLASCREIARILRCPSHVVPVVGFALGYADESGPLRDRLPLSGVVHQETYSDYTAADIEAAYRDRESAGWKRYMDIPDLRSSIEKVGAKNLAQIYTKAKYTRESHLEYSRNVLACLAEQGFFEHAP
ncbi:MAG: nitroreductase family protein [Bdellovibrionota bacterium]